MIKRNAFGQQMDANWRALTEHLNAITSKEIELSKAIEFHGVSASEWAVCSQAEGSADEQG